MKNAADLVRRCLQTDLDHIHKLYDWVIFSQWISGFSPRSEGKMRLTTRTNLAMRTLMFCAVNPGKTVRKHEVASACNASENHLAQVIHLLAQKGFLTTLRGRSGGLMLGKRPEDISVGDVFRSFEAVLPFAECFDHDANHCPLAGVCRLKCVLAGALAAFYEKLDAVSVADLVQDNAGLARLLKVA